MDGGKATRFIAPSGERTLAACFAHEINNPLDSLLNLLYLMKAEATFTEKGHHYLALAQEEVHRISQIAHSVLQDAREMTMLKNTNVPQLLRSVVDFYKARFDAKGISVSSRYCTDGDLGVYAGPLRQVFSNLLLNAADATPKGGRIHVRVSAAHEWVGEQRHGLRVIFADNGCGIAEDKMPMILEPFFTTKGNGGSGLGLALVRDVVQRHRGALRIRSSTKYGRSGSIFSIFLPEG